MCAFLSRVSPRLAATTDTFQYSGRVNWFPGHMSKALRLLSERVEGCDVVLEVRDARTPVSAINPFFEHLIGNDTYMTLVQRHSQETTLDFSTIARREKASPCRVKPCTRVVLLNKADLVSATDGAEAVKTLKTRYNQHAILVALNGHRGTHTSDVSSFVRSIITSVPSKKFKTTPVRVVVAGLPNSGKSTLINCLQIGGGRAKTGGVPGITRWTSTHLISRSPLTYISDCPGVMPPGSAIDTLAGLRLALCGTIKEGVVDTKVLADFALYCLNQRGMVKPYMTLAGLSSPSQSLTAVLRGLCVAAPHSQPSRAEFVDENDDENENENKSASLFLNLFRKGTLGKILLDDL